jgi:hypothetical protein
VESLCRSTKHVGVVSESAGSIVHASHGARHRRENRWVLDCTRDGFRPRVARVTCKA